VQCGEVVGLDEHHDARGSVVVGLVVGVERRERERVGGDGHRRVGQRGLESGALLVGVAGGRLGEEPEGDVHRLGRLSPVDCELVSLGSRDHGHHVGAGVNRCSRGGDSGAGASTGGIGVPPLRNVSARDRHRRVRVAQRELEHRRTAFSSSGSPVSAPHVYSSLIAAAVRVWFAPTLPHTIRGAGSSSPQFVLTSGTTICAVAWSACASPNPGSTGEHVDERLGQRAGAGLRWCRG
jgi:hypothetical protein